jgi:hypothetical protein
MSSAPHYLSTDPNAGEESPKYLSTDPSAGEAPSGPAKFEQDQEDQPGILGSAWDELKGQAEGAVKSILPSKENAYGLASPWGPLAPAMNAVSAAQNWERRKQEGRSVPYRVLTGATEMAGIPTGAAGEEEAAEHGNWRGVLGHAAIPALEAAAPLAGEATARGIPEIRESVGGAIHTPEGALTPTAKLAAKTATFGGSALAGHLLGFPNLYEDLIGGMLGARYETPLVESAINKVFPEPAARVAAREAAANATADAAKTNAAYDARGRFMNEGYRSVIPDIAPEPAEPGPGIMFRVDPNGTRWARAQGTMQEVSVPNNLSGQEAENYARQKLELQNEFKRGRGMTVLQRQIEQGAGWKPLEPNVPIGAQPRPLGAGVPTPEQIPPRVGVIPRVPLGSRIAVPIGEEFGPMVKGEGRIPTITTEEPGRQMGAPPLRPNVPLRGQFKPMEGEPMVSEQQKLEQRYPDKAVRQMVHANGERLVGAIGEDPDLMRDIHNLTNADVGHAAVNAGIDMGDMHVGSRKAMGAGQVSREALFNQMLDLGLTPKQILEFARKPF